MGKRPKKTEPGALVPAEPKAIVPLLGYQRRAVESKARFTHNNWSRQTGKSFTFSLKRIMRGLERRRNQIFLSASKSQSQELMLKARMHAEAIGVACKYIDDAYFEDTEIKQLEIRFGNGVRVIGLPANPRTARGFTGDVMLDEFAMHADDRAIWAALFPTVMRGNGEVDVTSTPKGKDNMFYRLVGNPRFEHTTVTIHDAVADGLEVDVEELRQALNDDELWRQEFLCEFVDEATAFLTYELIAGCEDISLPEPIRVHGEDGLDAVAEVLKSIDELGSCVLGVDIGRKRDFTVMWLCQELGKELVTRMVVEMAATRFRKQSETLHRILDYRNVRRTSIDETGIGMQLAEEAVEDYGETRVDAVTFTQEIKGKLAGQLRVRAEDRTIRIPASQDIRDDWHSVEKIVTTGGSVLYRADRNKWGHADRFWAAGLCVDAAGDVKPAWRGESVRQRRKAEGGRMNEEERERRREREEDRDRRRMRRHRLAVV